MVRGRLCSINISDGGVPKLPRQSCFVGVRGLEGDRQRDLRHHGGPMRAVCLYSLDLIQALRHEGHPIDVGGTGENLTIEGLSWSVMLPGAVVAVGEVVLTLTDFAAPCANVAGAFTNGEFKRISQKVHPGWSRVYARVENEGIVAQGDSVQLRNSG